MSGGMDERDRELLMHALAAIAYRTQKAVRGAPDPYWEFDPGNGARPAVQVLRHMTSLMGYTCTLWDGGSYPHEPEPMPSWEEEVARFHAMLEQVGARIESGRQPTISAKQLLQGPLADTLTHVGQLAYLRRLSGDAVPSENFIHADIRSDRLGPDQPAPAMPDAEWREVPGGRHDCVDRDDD